jgi:hypothetical protein
MTTVSHLPNDKWIITYEFYGAPEVAFAVYYRISDSPLTFSNATGRVIRGTDGSIPVGSPYNVWTPVGGSEGTVVVSCGSYPEVWVTQDIEALECGRNATWVRRETGAPTSYTRSLRVLPDPSQILLVGGGVLSGTNNSVTAGSIEIEGGDGAVAPKVRRGLGFRG